MKWFIITQFVKQLLEEGRIVWEADSLRQENYFFIDPCVFGEEPIML